MHVQFRGNTETPCHWAEVSLALRLDHQPARAEPFSKSIDTSSCGSRTGNILRRIAFTSWKIAVFAPMPRASDSTATKLNPGLCFNCRSPYRTSCLIDSSIVILRSEEHTSELQSRFDLVCRLLLEKKKI